MAQPLESLPAPCRSIEEPAPVDWQSHGEIWAMFEPNRSAQRPGASLRGPAHRVDAARGVSLNFDLRAEFDDLPCRHAEKGGRALGIALQEGKQRFPPNPHPGNVLAGNDGLAADVIGDVAEVDPRQLALAAGESEAFGDRRILHEAKMQDDPRDAFDDLDHLR